MLFGVSALLSGSNLYYALKGGNERFTHTSSQLLTASSGLVLTAAVVIFAISPQRRVIPVTAAVIALALAIWGMLAN
jgi:hypothetical protein